MRELFSCEACGASFSTQAELAGHASVHAGGHEHERYKCQACGATFHSSAQLAEHAREKHPMAQH